ncbi:AcvB/VirJ family lysyl-phosphatidylglycerol hydrolase [Rhodoblastus sp.]|uniref:virulence factor family protein n=1 Tax=Rhodoblastus sp. TaxID=1962975 RepID=UPI002613E49B|nr:AcvB/VirJ family lysyl-phosphatidylglycerol hydrolase [Rhodoblastus sp.]
MRLRLILASLALLVLVGALFFPKRVAVVERDGGPYGRVLVAEPHGEAKAYVQIYFTPKDWDGQGRAMLRKLAGRGAIAIGVDTKNYLDRIARGAPKCLDLLGDAETLSKLIQRERVGEDYRLPLLAGAGPGGTAALLALSQAMPNTIASAVTIDPAAELDTAAPVCAKVQPTPNGKGFVYAAPPVLNGLWMLAETPGYAPENKAHFQEWTGAGLTATQVALASGDTDAELLGLISRATKPSGKTLDNLPIVELPSEKPSRTLAIVLSGDGGWRDLDKTIAERLRQKGVNVVGLDSLRYFWARKSPMRTTEDVAAIIEAYSRKWGAEDVALIGYSFGADVAPFVYNGLPQALRDKVRLVSLLGPERAADWRIRVVGWLGAEPSKDALPTGPQLAAIPGKLIQCFYGEDDKAASCATLKNPEAEIVKTRGSHHFDGDYNALAEKILARLKGESPSGARL